MLLPLRETVGPLSRISSPIQASQNRSPKVASLALPRDVRRAGCANLLNIYLYWSSSLTIKVFCLVEALCNTFTIFDEVDGLLCMRTDRVVGTVTTRGGSSLETSLA